MKASHMGDRLYDLMESDYQKFNEELRYLGWLSTNEVAGLVEKASDRQLVSLLAQEEKLKISEELKAALATFYRSPFCANHIADRINSVRCLLAEILALAKGCDPTNERRLQQVMDILWLMRLEVIEKDD